MDSRQIIAAMELSAAAYRDIQPLVAEEKLAEINSETTGVQCFLRRRGDLLKVTFRGTDSMRDWRTDFKFWRRTIPYDNQATKIRVHTGFINAYKAQGVRDVIQAAVAEGVRRISIAGHSYGAALAVLCAVDLEYNFPNRDLEVFLFGCPRVGNRAFQESYDRRVFKTLRIENGNDIVTHVPLALWGYRHVGSKLHVGKPRLPFILSVKAHHPNAYYAAILNALLPKLPYAPN
ncbi:MAG: lipase family protein [Christensenellaceae bacterium]|jgi:predicted lipase|nr:lipase family protein [Christensenellaceae bacterium]